MILLFIIIMEAITPTPPATVTATVYHPVEAQTDSTPLITASGAKINPDHPLSHRWVAISRDLEKLGYTLGKKILVQGAGDYNGIWTIQDRMNYRWKRRIDFLIGLNDPIGKWKNVTINLITNNK